mgnify:CR=1 FL=1
MPLSISQLQKNRPSIYRIVLRMLLALCCMSAVMFIAGPIYIRGFLPLFKKQIKFLHPEYDIHEFYLNEKNQIMFQVRVNRFMVDEQGRPVGGTEAKAGIRGWTMYTAPIIIFSIILAWPGLALRARAKVFLVSLPLLFLSQLIDIPIHCINRIEAPWPSESLLSELRTFWAFVLTNGGRQFMAFFIALFSIFSSRWVIPERGEAPVGRNDPCPCGSGKKYKYCCGK